MSTTNCHPSFLSCMSEHMHIVRSVSKVLRTPVYKGCIKIDIRLNLTFDGLMKHGSAGTTQSQSWDDNDSNNYQCKSKTMLHDGILCSEQCTERVAIECFGWARYPSCVCVWNVWTKYGDLHALWPISSTLECFETFTSYVVRTQGSSYILDLIWIWTTMYHPSQHWHPKAMKKTWRGSSTVPWAKIHGQWHFAKRLEFIGKTQQIHHCSP